VTDYVLIEKVHTAGSVYLSMAIEQFAMSDSAADSVGISKKTRKSALSFKLQVFLLLLI